MRAAEPREPPGYLRFTMDDGVAVTCADHLATAVRTALRDGSLYEFAQHRADARPLAGRGVAYAIALPATDERVVVRHNRHGGLLAPLRRDLFPPPTRAPLELAIAERLRAAGVPTPRVLACVVYPAGPFRRADVMTREVPSAVDLSAPLHGDDAAARVRALTATAELVRVLSDAGAHHHDLNIKNVLLHAPAGGELVALALDVDRVSFGHTPNEARAANITRLLRSARKWRVERGAQVTESELETFAANAGAPGAPDARAITLS